MFDYYRWVSGGRVSVTGRVVATVRLPEREAFYAGLSGGLRGNAPNNALGALRDALRACADTIDWRPYDVDTDGVSAYTYVNANDAPGAPVVGRKLAADMERGGDRYLRPGERDFFAFFADPSYASAAATASGATANAPTR